MRPFILRPLGYAAFPAAFVAAACYFFWAPLTQVMLEYAIVLPILCAAVPTLVLIERIVRYRKTDYEVRSDRLVVRTGTIFRDRSIELELENVTLVEWKSPYLLRLFYGAGHVTAQEAGSATQNARLAYVENPETIYRQIAENMRNRGFSMRRSDMVRQEQPGPTGAFVDLVGRIAALIYGFAVFGATEGADLWLFFADDAGPSVLQLVQGNYDAFGTWAFGVEVLARMRLGVLVLGAIGLLGSTLWLALTYIDLLRRTYTLHDDVIDYEDGFLSQTRQFIPLENLADTKLTRPLHKRLLGFGDLKVSSRGAGSEIVLRSLPRGKDFASALEGLLERTDAPGERLGENGNAGEYVIDTVEPSAERRKTIRARTFKPWPMRMVVSALVGMLPVTAGLLVAPVTAVMAGDAFELGPITIASVGAIGLAALAVGGAIGAFGIINSLIQAHATEYSFDERRVCEQFDFLSSRQTRFSVDKITSFSVLRNPLDRLMGTMKVRVRSIGSEETIDFGNIRYDQELLDALRHALGVERPQSMDAAHELLRPEFSLVEAIKAKLDLFALAPVAWAMGIAIAALLDSRFGEGGLLWFGILGSLLALTALPIAVNLLWRWVYHGRLRGRLYREHLEVAGGIFRHFRHVAAYRHIKAVTTIQYPASEQGDLELATGGGFSFKIGHLPDIARIHRNLDERLSEYPPLAARAHESAHTGRRRLVPYAPHVGTELLRHLRFVVTIVTFPISGIWVYLLYRGASYRLERDCVFAEIGLIYHRRTSVLYDRIDHLETARSFAHGVFGTADVEVYTVGSTSCDLRLRSLERSESALEHIRERVATG